MEPGGIGCADFDPALPRPREILDHDRGVVGIGDPALGERDPLPVLEAVGQQARQKILLALRGVARRLDAQALVDAAVHVAEVDLDRVHEEADLASGTEATVMVVVREQRVPPG